jgi:hypothetical protein
MLNEVEQQYVNDVTDVMKMIIDDGYCHEETVRQSTGDNWNGRLAFYLPWGIDVDTVADFTSEHDGASVKTTRGALVLDYDCFEVSGSALHFIAFCFQERELLPSPNFFKTEEQRKRYNLDSPDLSRVCYDDDYVFDLAEWREYIKNKYHILPPKLDEGFKELLEYGVLVTGGLTF